MNLINQRCDLVDAQKAGCISKSQLEMALSSPVFCWHSGVRQIKPEEQEWLLSNVMVQVGRALAFPKHVPYECFRISYTDSRIYEQWWIGDDAALCFRCDDGYSHPEVKMWSVHSYHLGDEWVKLWVWINGIKMDTKTYKAGKVSMLSSEEEFTNFAGSPSNWLAFFLFDVMSNTSTVVKVSNDQPGRSVEWHRARTHYLVLHHQHAQKCQQSGKGPSTQDIVRGAHWRRAHLRRLMSDKFKRKRGLLVPVKKSWVGPEEWKGKDGKIYKITTFKPK